MAVAFTSGEIRQKYDRAASWYDRVEGVLEILGIGQWQDRHADGHARHLGCHWNREPLDLVRQAGVTVTVARRTFGGVFHVIEARP